MRSIPRPPVVLLAVGITVMWSLLVAVEAVSGAAVAASPSKLYVALGDSVTKFGSTSGLRYPERFFAHLKPVGAADTLQNIGVPGETSSSILGAQLAQALQLINDPATNTTMVTLDIGGNDFLGDPRCNPTSSGFSLVACQPVLAAFAKNYRSLLDQLDKALAHEPRPNRVIVMPYYNPWSGRPGQETAAANAELVMLGSDKKLDCAGRGTALGLNDLIACIGAQHRALVADVYPSFVGKGAQWITADGIHPNDLGHAAIAAVFAKVFDRAAHPIRAVVSCSPGTVLVGKPTACRARVTDIAGSGPTPPTGTVSFKSSGAGRFNPGSCTLSGSGVSANCPVFYTPTAVGSGTHTLTASYRGDGFHRPGAATTRLAVKPARPNSHLCGLSAWSNDSNSLVAVQGVRADQSVGDAGLAIPVTAVGSTAAPLRRTSVSPTVAALPLLAHLKHAGAPSDDHFRTAPCR